MTKARIRTIRAHAGTLDINSRIMVGQLIDEVERFQSILRRGDDLKSEPEPDLVKLPPAGPKKKARGTLEEFQAFAKSLGLPESDGEAMFWKMTASDWKIGRNPVKDWKATIRQWKAAGYHPSQNQKNGHSAPQERTGPARCNL